MASDGPNWDPWAASAEKLPMKGGAAADPSRGACDPWATYAKGTPRKASPQRASSSCGLSSSPTPESGYKDGSDIQDAQATLFLGSPFRIWLAENEGSLRCEFDVGPMLRLHAVKGVRAKWRAMTDADRFVYEQKFKLVQVSPEYQSWQSKALKDVSPPVQREVCSRQTDAQTRVSERRARGEVRKVLALRAKAMGTMTQRPSFGTSLRRQCRRQLENGPMTCQSFWGALPHTARCPWRMRRSPSRTAGSAFGMRSLCWGRAAAAAAWAADGVRSGEVEVCFTKGSLSAGWSCLKHGRGTVPEGSPFHRN